MRPARIIILYMAFYFLFLISAHNAGAERGLYIYSKTEELNGKSNLEKVLLYDASYALVIGIDHYRNGNPRLFNSVRDAVLVTKVLEEKGFDVTLRKDLDSEQLKKAFEEFFILKGQRPHARLFVWFSGHGATVDGEGFLVPADAPPKEDTALFKLKSLSLRRFGEYMRLARSKHAMAVFDSCFSGTVFNTERSTPPAAVTRATALPVRQFLSSGDANQTVPDDGRFRKLFIRALRGQEKADLNHDGYLTGSELGMFLSDRFTNLTRGKQTPRTCRGS